MENKEAGIPSGLFCTGRDRLISSRIMKLKGFDWASKELSRKRYEKYARLSYSANCMRITAESMPEIYQDVCEISEKLGITVPDIYLQRNTAPGAYALGETEPMLIVTTELVRLLPAAELKIMLTQALVHIHSGHLKSFMVRDLIGSASDNFGIFKSVVALPRMLLEEWAVEAELSADRGMLVVCADFELAVSAYARLATGGIGKCSIETLLADYDKFSDNSLATPTCAVFRTWADLYRGNERYIYRIGKLRDFSESAEYKAWVAGDYSVGDSAESAAEPDEESGYYDEFGARGEAWEAEDIHAKIAWGLPDTKATADFLRIHLGDIFKLGIDGARDFTAEMVAGISNFFSTGGKKDKK